LEGEGGGGDTEVTEHNGIIQTPKTEKREEAHGWVSDDLTVITVVMRGGGGYTEHNGIQTQKTKKGGGRLSAKAQGCSLLSMPHPLCVSDKRSFGPNFKTEPFSGVLHGVGTPLVPAPPARRSAPRTPPHPCSAAAAAAAQQAPAAVVFPSCAPPQDYLRKE
jgi:hypothetical protein